MAEDRIIYRFLGDTSGLISACKKGKKALSSFSDEAKKADKETEKLGSSLTSLGGEGGGAALAGASAAITTALTAITAAAAAAAVAITAVVAVVAVAVTAAAAFAAGVAVAVKRMHEFILAANDTRKELEPLYKLGALRPLRKDQINALQRYSDIWKALKIVIQEVSVAVAGNLAKDLEGVLFQVLVVALHLRNLFLDWQEGASIIRTLTIEWMIMPLKKWQGIMLLFLKEWAASFKALEQLGLVQKGTFDALITSVENLDNQARELAGSLIDLGTKAAGDMFNDMTRGMYLAEIEANRLLQSLKKIDEEAGGIDTSAWGGAGIVVDKDPKKGPVSADGGTRDTGQGFDLEVDLTELQKAGKLIGDLRGRFDSLTDPTGILRDTVGEIAGSFAEIAATDWKGLEKGLEKTAATTEAVAGAFRSLGKIMQSVIARQMASSDELTEKQKKNVKLMFAVQQAATIASIIMDTAGAIMRAYNDLGFVAGTIAAGILTSIGAVQVGVVASEKPPSFHTGGIIPAPPGAQGVLMNALPGESVLNREATAGLGAEGVSALNSGVSKGNISISMVYKHRIFDNFVQDNISKGGPLRDAIRSGRRVGHRGS